MMLCTPTAFSLQLESTKELGLIEEKKDILRIPEPACSLLHVVDSQARFPRSPIILCATLFFNLASILFYYYQLIEY